MLVSEILKKNSGDIAHREYIFYLAVAHTRIKVGATFSLLRHSPLGHKPNGLKLKHIGANTLNLGIGLGQGFRHLLRGLKDLGLYA